MYLNSERKPRLSVLLYLPELKVQSVEFETFVKPTKESILKTKWN